MRPCNYVPENIKTCGTCRHTARVGSLRYPSLCCTLNDPPTFPVMEYFSEEADEWLSARRVNERGSCPAWEKRDDA